MTATERSGTSPGTWDTGQSNNHWTSNFGAAERLHQHFYHGDLTKDLLRSHRQATLNGTMELLRAL